MCIWLLLNHMLEIFFKNLESDGISVTDNFIDQSAIRKIANWSGTLRSQNAFIEAKISGEKLLKKEIRGDSTFWLDPVAPNAEWMPFKIFLDSLQEKLNKRFFLGIKQYECHLAHYPIKAFYKKHLDRLSDNSSRVFTFIIYLNEDWKKADGGELVIFDKSGNEIKRILPEFGTLVGFMSDEFPHEVLPANRERFSFTGWMHNRILY